MANARRALPAFGNLNGAPSFLSADKRKTILSSERGRSSDSVKRLFRQGAEEAKVVRAILSSRSSRK